MSEGGREYMSCDQSSKLSLKSKNMIFYLLVFSIRELFRL